MQLVDALARQIGEMRKISRAGSATSFGSSRAY
jgi:hypothetical protein